jgi:DNA-binding NtrC family response regulator
MPTRNILVIEDDPAVARATARMLVRKGFSVQLAESGEVGESFLTCSDRHIDTVIVDYTLPGANGLQVAERLCGRFPNLRFILMSGLDQESLPQEIMTSCFSGFLQKPFMMNDLFNAIGLAASKPVSVSC